MATQRQLLIIKYYHISYIYYLEIHNFFCITHTSETIRNLQHALTAVNFSNHSIEERTSQQSQLDIQLVIYYTQYTYSAAEQESKTFLLIRSPEIGPNACISCLYHELSSYNCINDYLFTPICSYYYATILKISDVTRGHMIYMNSIRLLH